jgi:hypothetical protein
MFAEIEFNQLGDDKVRVITLKIKNSVPSLFGV